MSRPHDGPVLVLGGTGFLGVHLVDGALGGGARVVSAARRAPRHGAPPVPGAAAPEFRRWDALESGATERLFADVRPARVVLAAALSRMADCEREPGTAERLNVRLPEELAGLTRRTGARLVHVSTDLVFGGAPPAADAYAESDPPSPLHVYGRSKAEGEERVLAADPTALVVRLPLLYGESFGRGLGASDSILAAIERGERPRLFRDEWRTPLEVGNAARALLELCRSELSGVLHVAGPDRLSRLELGLRVLAAAGRSSDEVAPAVRADLGLDGSRPSDVSLDSSRAARVLATRLLGPVEALSGMRPA